MKENKTVNEWKKEIEEDIHKIKLEIVDCVKSDIATTYYCARLKEKIDQLQMIDNIIEMINDLDKDILIIFPQEQAGIRKFKERLLGE